MMIVITEQLSLQTITNSDCTVLYNLLKEIYPPTYQHFWKDKGNWYVENQYSKAAVLKELSEEKAAYYFILFNQKIIGNFRIVWDKKLNGFEAKKSVKLHRIYLHPNTQGKGIGKKLLNWLEKKAKEKMYELIWLDAMNEQPQALQFYKNAGYQYYSHERLDFELLHDEYRKMSQYYKILSP